MKKFILGFVIGIAFACLFGLILAFAAIRFGDRTPTVAANSVLVLHLEGDLPEQPAVDVPLPFLQDQQPLTVVEAWRLLQQAATDSRIKAVVLEPRNLEAGWAKLEELRADIVAFKKSGKPVQAYLRGGRSACRILRRHCRRRHFHGARRQTRTSRAYGRNYCYLKGGLDKLGVHDGVRARREIQRRSGPVHGHVSQSRDPGSHQPDPRSILRRHRLCDCGGP